MTKPPYWTPEVEREIEEEQLPAMFLLGEISKERVSPACEVGCAFCHGTGVALDGDECEDCEGTGSL